MSDPIRPGTPTGPVRAPTANTSPARVVEVPMPKPNQSMIPALKAQMGQYLEMMDVTRQVSEATTAQAQGHMWSILNLMFSRPANEFTELWGTFLEIIHSRLSKEFAATHIFRGVPKATAFGSSENRKNFVRLMTLARDTADPTTRALKMRHIRLQHVLRGFPNPEVLNRLAEFYRV